MEKLAKREIFRCTESEKNLLQKLADEIKVSKSDYLRHVIRSREIPKILPKTEQNEVQKTEEFLEKNYYALGKIGVNINQIAWYFNLEHLKSFDNKNHTIDDFLLLDRVKKSEIILLQESLSKLSENIDEIKKMFEARLNEK